MIDQVNPKKVWLKRAIALMMASLAGFLIYTASASEDTWLPEFARDFVDSLPGNEYDFPRELQKILLPQPLLEKHDLTDKKKAAFAPKASAQGIGYCDDKEEQFQFSNRDFSVLIPSEWCLAFGSGSAISAAGGENYDFAYDWYLRSKMKANSIKYARYDCDKEGWVPNDLARAVMVAGEEVRKVKTITCSDGKKIEIILEKDESGNRSGLGVTNQTDLYFCPIAECGSAYDHTDSLDSTNSDLPAPRKGRDENGWDPRHLYNVRITQRDGKVYSEGTSIADFHKWAKEYAPAAGYLKNDELTAQWKPKNVQDRSQIIVFDLYVPCEAPDDPDAASYPDLKDNHEQTAREWSEVYASHSVNPMNKDIIDHYYGGCIKELGRLDGRRFTVDPPDAPKRYWEKTGAQAFMVWLPPVNTNSDWPHIKHPKIIELRTTSPKLVRSECMDRSGSYIGKALCGDRPLGLLLRGEDILHVLLGDEGTISRYFEGTPEEIEAAQRAFIEDCQKPGSAYAYEGERKLLLVDCQTVLAWNKDYETSLKVINSFTYTGKILFVPVTPKKPIPQLTPYSRPVPVPTNYATPDFGTPPPRGRF